MQDTIAAIATPNAAGGIGIVRISGSRAIEIADRVFKAKSGLLLSQLQGYNALYGTIMDKQSAVDEAISLVFKAPKSYTGEDVVEFSCHGGLFVMQRVLRTVLDNGARAAQAGEFTKRAFLNGRIDLTEAESVMNIISAHGEQAASAALNALDGALSRKTSEITQVFLSAAAHMSAWVDYPDEDIEELNFDSLLEDYTNAKSELEGLLVNFDAGQAITQGVETAIVGRPNVGKSTLMNMLLGTERSIVTSYAGTTRDIIEETVKIGNVVLRLADTAGIRNSDDPVESIGIDRAKKKLARAGLVIAVFDASEQLNDEDFELLELCKNKNSIAVINKTDLSLVFDEQKIKNFVKQCVFISATNLQGYDELKEAIETVLETQQIDTSAAMIATERQRDCCKRAIECVDEAIFAMKSGLTMDAVNVSTDCVIDALLEITGKKASEAVVDKVFENFCVGK
ncbi:MAG: tRNA uridine-5-carboxymethylaminomethyl(34) synthesis GTPase MnmE [Clostridia bacterium]|nr:tRNA uridine-5-carboxymethylaminomethyl(34) synthesis GTPase MnmE [Clostridia bacterium]